MMPLNVKPGPSSVPSAPVAVVMITLNEGHNLDGVLQNLRGWAQEVFVVDSYSADDTVDVALRYGAHVVQHAFKGFGDQWNFALRELPITSPWTMKLDPDERLTDELKHSLIQAMNRGEADGYTMNRRLWFMGRPLPVRHELLRVWKSGACKFSDVLVNEHPFVEGHLQHVEGDIEHHDSPDLHHWLEKQNAYTTTEAIAVHQGQALSVTPRIFGSALQRRMWIKQNYRRFPGRYLVLFLHHYLAQGAWRAGWVGYAWARLRSDVYRLWEYKLREIRITGRIPRKGPKGPGQPDPRVAQY
ncbi:glycosyltransferase family 2 protein [Arenimonas sp.]|uniref:glycosyltransferase family 2 protein n=1 Tax=Arenimonas sp. TaxID=1872635 RepID=UPI0025C560D5|nr:glycosyltransferase family 2 protein [Arenimonas sp.]